MAQFDDIRRHSPSSRSPRNFDHLLKGDGLNSPIIARNHDPEEYHIHLTTNKKSVLAKVKEKARKLRYTFSGRIIKKDVHDSDDGNSTPSWGVRLDDDDDYEEEDPDPEYLGAPMYESELAPESLRETARQHPRANPVVSDKHIVPNGFMREAEPVKAITATMTDKLAPSAVVSDAKHTIATVKTESDKPGTTETDSSHPGIGIGIDGIGKEEKSSENRVCATRGSSLEGLDKGVSVKENLTHNLEPGEDDKAPSKVLTNTVCPNKPSVDKGVVEKVREAVNSLIRSKEPSNSATVPPNPSSNIGTSARANSFPHIPVFANTSSSPQMSISSSANSSPVIPISTNAHEVTEEENHGRILQAN